MKANHGGDERDLASREVYHQLNKCLAPTCLPGRDSLLAELACPGGVYRGINSPLIIELAIRLIRHYDWQNMEQLTDRRIYSCNPRYSASMADCTLASIAQKCCVSAS